jgi:hypothetical protein
MKKVLTGIVTVLGVLYGFYEFYDNFIGGEDFGTKIEIGSLEVYYTDNINEPVANKLANYLDSIDFTGGDAMSVQVDKQYALYQVNLALREGVANNEEYSELFRNVVNNMKTYVFPNDSLTLNLGDASFTTQQSIPYDVMLHKPYGDMVLFNGTEVYYRNVDVALANALGDYLVESEFADGNAKAVQLSRIEGKLAFNMLVDSVYINNPELEIAFQEMRAELIAGAFANESIELHLSDNPFETEQIFK